MTANQSQSLKKILESRIAIIDGAMGTTIRTYGMTEADIRGERFRDSTKDMLNNGDLFSLTQPEMICDIHRRFLEAGADIIETNTFGATSITQSEFFVEDPREHGGRKDPAFYQKVIEDPFLQGLAWEINEQSARQCREWADRVGNATGRQRFVAGAIGPLTVSLSNSPDADDAGFRVVTFDQVRTAYVEQVRALMAGGSDLLLVETIFDSLNAKAALVAIREVFDEDGQGAAGDDLGGCGAWRGDADFGADDGGVLECGEACEAALGGSELLAGTGPDVSVLWRSFRRRRMWRSRAIRMRVCRIRSRRRGLIWGRTTWRATWASLREDGLINIAGGCCGNTPEHIAAIAKALEGQAPRRLGTEWRLRRERAQSGDRSRFGFRDRSRLRSSPGCTSCWASGPTWPDRRSLRS